MHQRSQSARNGNDAGAASNGNKINNEEEEVGDDFAIPIAIPEGGKNHRDVVMVVRDGTVDSTTNIPEASGKEATIRLQVEEKNGEGSLLKKKTHLMMKILISAIQMQL